MSVWIHQTAAETNRNKELRVCILDDLSERCSSNLLDDVSVDIEIGEWRTVLICCDIETLVNCLDRNQIVSVVIEESKG